MFKKLFGSMLKVSKINVIQNGIEKIAKFIDSKTRVITDGGNNYAIVYEYVDENNKKRKGISKNFFNQLELDYFKKMENFKIVCLGKKSEIVEKIDISKVVPTNGDF